MLSWIHCGYFKANYYTYSLIFLNRPDRYSNGKIYLIEKTLWKFPKFSSTWIWLPLANKTFFLAILFIFLNFNWKLITILWWFLPYIHMNQPWVYMCSPYWPSIPPPSPSHPSGSSQCTSPEHAALCIESGLARYFAYDNIHISMLFSQIIPPPPPPTESNSLFFTSVSLLLSLK